MNLFDLYAKITLDTSDYEDGVDSAREKGNSLAGVLKGGLATAGKVAAAGLAAAGGAAVALGKSALDSYAQYEQLVGGVDTLFKESSDKLQGYAANAYQTAGMNANDYMSTVTSFSAALINSLGGDTEAAADMSNQAITDMADNANKMGTSIDSIVQTYQSLSRGNFAMLDNLKLGYGGTKAELERLLDDAEAYKASMGEIADYDASSFADIVSAIGAIQEKMGIAGATADEAATTIEGSTNAMKAAWSNLVTGIANENADIPALLGTFLESVGTVADNVIPRVGQIAEGIGTLIVTAAPQMVEAGKNLLSNLGDGITKAIPLVTEKVPEIVTKFIEWWTEQYPVILQQGADILEKLAFGIIEAIPKLIGMLPKVISSMVNYFAENFPKIAEIGGELLGNLIAGILGMIPEIAVQIPKVIEAIVEAFVMGYSALVDAGAHLLEGLWDGIADKVEWLKGKVTGVVDTIKSWFTGPEGFDEHSPSKWAKSVGEYMMEGLAIGMENSKGEVMETADDIINEVKSRFDGLVDNLTLQQDVGDLEYELWEKTYGQAATDAEKYEQKLKILNAQEAIQAGVVETAYHAYLAMTEQYGENSAESLNYQKILLQEGIQYQELLSDIQAVIDAKEQLAAGTPMGTVSMADSTVGKASAQMINSNNRADPVFDSQPTNIKLVTSDNQVMAEWLLPAMRHVDKSNPEVVSDPI